MPEKNKRFLRRTKDQLGDAWETARDRVEETTEKTRDTIRDYPFTSIIIAAAVGAVAGALTSEVIRRSRRKDKSFMRKIRRYF